MRYGFVFRSEASDRALWIRTDHSPGGGLAVRLGGGHVGDEVGSGQQVTGIRAME